MEITEFRPEDWTRKAFQVDETVLPDEAIEPDKNAVMDELFLSGIYPCVYSDSGTLKLTEAAQIRSYNRAIGLLTAASIVGYGTTPDGIGGNVRLVKRKLLDVEYTFQVTSPGENAAGWRTEGMRIMELLGCGRTAGLDGISGGLLVGVHPNTDSAGRLTDNRGIPYRYGAAAGRRRLW
jgi:hypothetical protein